jgi:hypothetical protein
MNVYNKNSLLFENIKSYEYHNVAKKLKEYFKDTNVNIFQKMVDIAKNMSDKIILNPTDIESLLMIYYTQCRPDIRLSIINAIVDQELVGKINKFKKKNNVYVIKTIKLTYHEFFPFLYQIFFNRNTYTSFSDIKQICDKLFNKQNYKYFVLVLYEKNEDLRNALELETDFSFYSENFIETIELTKFLFNNNSLNSLKYIYVRNYYNPRFVNCKNYLITFKKWLYENINPLDRDRVLIYSSAILYIYGIRDCQDLDIYVNWLPLKGNNKNFSNKINKIAFSNNKLDFVDLAYKGIGEWVKGGKKEYLDDWFIKEWPSLFGANDMQEVCFNPSFYFSFLGLKFITLEGDIARRKCRSRPASYADLIAINYYLKLNIEIPRLPTEYYKISASGKKNKLDNLEKMIEFYKKIQNRLIIRFGLKMNLDKIIKLVPPNKELEKYIL